MSGDNWAKNRINENENLNDFILPGTYICQSYSIAQTLLNCPYKDGNFKLFVIQNTGSETITGNRWLNQIIFTSKNRIFIRSHEENIWYNWKIIGRDESAKILRINEDNIDTLQIQGFYFTRDPDYSNRLGTFPTNSYINHILSLSESTGNYNARLQLLFPFYNTTNKIFVRRQSGNANAGIVSTWNNWEQVYPDYSNINLTQNGYISFTNGLIIQWGTADISLEYYLNNKFYNTLINKYYILHSINYPISFTSKAFFTFAYDADFTISEFNDTVKNQYANESGEFPVSRPFYKMNTTSTAYFIWEQGIDNTIGLYTVFSIGM